MKRLLPTTRLLDRGPGRYIRADGKEDIIDKQVAVKRTVGHHSNFDGNALIDPVAQIDSMLYPTNGGLIGAKIIFIGDVSIIDDNLGNIKATRIFRGNPVIIGEVWRPGRNDNLLANIAEIIISPTQPDGLRTTPGGNIAGE